MVKILFPFFVILFLPMSVFCNNDSLLQSKISAIRISQEKIILRQDSIGREIADFEESYKLKESLFSNQMNILTTIFSAIVAISIFVIGYLIPRLNDEKYKNELNKVVSEFEILKDEIQKNREETAKIEIQDNFNHSRIMFFSCSNAGYKSGELLWALRHCKHSYKRYKNPNNTDVSYFINRAKDVVVEIKNEDNLKEYVDEINSLVSELTAMYLVEGYNEKLIYIKEEYNKACWAGN